MAREISVRVSARTVLLTVLTLAAVWLTILLQHVLVLFFVSVMLAVGISGAVNRLERLKLPRSLAILMVYLLLLLLLVGMGFILVPLVLKQIGILRTELPRLVGEPLRQGSELIAERFPELRSSLPTGDFAQQSAQALTALIGNVGSAAISLGRSTVSFLINLLVVLVLSFFLLSRRDIVEHTIEIFVPTAYQARLLAVSKTIGRRLGRWVIAQLVIATFYAVCFGTGLRILGVPYALSLGVIGGILELVPYVGGFVATILTMIVAFTVEPSLALWVLGLHVVIGNIEVHVLAPKVMGRAVETHPVVAILALFSGVELLGFVGAFIAIPLAVVGQTLVEEFWIKRVKQAKHVATYTPPAVEPPSLIDDESPPPQTAHSSHQA